MTPERLKEIETLAVYAAGPLQTTYEMQEAMKAFEFAMLPRDVLYLIREVRDLRSKLRASEEDAILGRIAMRFVDRAGDYCPEDPAERICDEFNRAIADAVEDTKP